MLDAHYQQPCGGDQIKYDRRTSARTHWVRCRARKKIYAYTCMFGTDTTNAAALLVEPRQHTRMTQPPTGGTAVICTGALEVRE
jgi:hypothetical protein